MYIGDASDPIADTYRFQFVADCNPMLHLRLPFQIGRASHLICNGCNKKGRTDILFWRALRSVFQRKQSKMGAITKDIQPTRVTRWLIKLLTQLVYDVSTRVTHWLIKKAPNLRFCTFLAAL